MNAYAAKDMETMLGFYTDNARFGSTESQWNTTTDFETRKEETKAMFEKIKDIHFTQSGYPDCIYYAKNNRYEVYSWWEYSFTYVESGEKVVMPLMLSHSFNDDGKIVFEQAYYSTNHFDR
ncbi:MAG: nuclear transport factor 2 family protein [Draconibacterium sp.]